MAQRGSGPDFIEALARGLHVLRSFSPAQPTMRLSDVATAADLARPTARRILLTLEELGYVRSDDAGAYTLTPRVLELGMAYVGSLGLWDIARPHLHDLVARTGESSSMSQLDGSDIVYVSRVAVPKLIALRVEIGTRFPAMVTSQGKVLLAALDFDEVLTALSERTRSGLPAPAITEPDLAATLAEVRDQGWAVADNELAPGVRSIAVPVADGGGVVRAAMNVTVHSAETSLETLTGRYLPLLQETAAQISADWAQWQSRPIERVQPHRSTA
ncbi:IclR family transcriptional regulator domain-containing protein [Williamsia phyllosphaerae]|uniref:IclR family transcriptional regulator n=1 Tax=Williamsia phyllosphaerae TaxID=885042 RepID=A0ABQ1UAK3_9NOCA|nr:IclR family transcriptional regulator C-terminal domain-containing protein [Williamsia phyllosphaerae]GGF11641.1 IclR family transcriptional regulator [Williamsia phyllosphaerae]